jgi:hypothetical protein
MVWHSQQVPCSSKQTVTSCCKLCCCKQTLPPPLPHHRLRLGHSSICADTLTHLAHTGAAHQQQLPVGPSPVLLQST